MESLFLFEGPSFADEVKKRRQGGKGPLFSAYAVFPVSELSDELVDVIEKIAKSSFKNIGRQRLVQDLMNEDYVLLLPDRAKEQIVGFTTIKIVKDSVNGRQVSIYNVDASAVLKDYWHENLAAYPALDFAFFNVASNPSADWYWISPVCSYHSYCYFLALFTECYPNYRQDTPTAEAELLKYFCEKIYGSDWNAQQGITCNSYLLWEDVGAIPPNKRADPHVQFFCKANPNWADGNDLPVIMPLRESNLTRLSKRIIQRGC